MNTEQSNKNSLMKWGILALVIVLLIGGFALYHHHKYSGPVTNFTPEFEAEQTQITTEQEPSVSRGIEIPGYSVIPVTAGSKDVNIDLYNPEGNNVYFQLTFFLSDTGEQIYQSKLLKPGQHIYTITLDRALEAGEYPLTIQYSTFTTDDSYTPRNGATVNCILQAK